MTASFTAYLQTTMPEVLRAAAEQWPDKAGVDFCGEIYSFAQIQRRVTHLAHGLAALGIGRGARVCSMLDNNSDQFFLWFAVVQLGAVSVPLNTALRGEFLRHQIADAGCVVVVSEAHYLERLHAIEGELTEVKTVLVRGDADKVPLRFDVRSLADCYLLNDESITIDVAPSDLAMVIYTSGTTGPSKGCMISHNHVCNTGKRMALGADIGHDDVFWTPLPMYHMGAAGFSLGCMQLGATASIYSQFSLSKFWPEIERSRASVICIISIMLGLVADGADCEESKRCFGQIRAVAGVPFPDVLQEKWQSRFGVKYTGAMGFGMTEATPMTFTPVSEKSPAGASGRRYSDYDVQVVDDDDRILLTGEVGQLVMRPMRPNIMFMGYWRRPEATLEVMQNMWFHTGDIGRFDTDGNFYFVDRKKDYLRRGGENISSYEMEMSFRAHPDIEDVAVHAVPSDHSEDEVKASVILRATGSVTEEELCRWSIEHLPHYAVPRYIEFCAELPRNGSGRVMKFELRSRGVTPATWDRLTSDIKISKR